MVKKKDFGGTFETYPLSISTTEQSVGLYSRACFNCKVKNTYDPGNSKNYIEGNEDQSTSINAHTLINDGC